MRDYLLHLTDLHFGENIYDVGKWYKSSTVYNILHFIKNAGFDYQTHNIKTLKALDNCIARIYKKIIVNEESFIGCALTGDITTNPGDDTTINNFHYKYISSAVEFYGKEIGLNVNPESIICSLGNHDSIGLPTPKLFVDSRFGDPFENRINDQTSKADYIHYAKSSNFKRLYVFFCIDSNYYKSGNLANGEISPDQINWFTNENENISSPEGFTFDNDKYKCSEGEIVKIVLLHHPPLLPTHVKLNPKTLATYLHLRIIDKGTKRFMNEIAPFVDIIMCGHHHSTFFKEIDNAYIISSGSTSEYSFPSDNYFNLLSFGEETFDFFGYKYLDDHGKFDIVTSMSNKPLHI